MVKRLISSFFEIISVKDGEKGEDGSNIYPQDVWSPDVTYLANQYFRPFVMYRENENQEYEYYLLVTDEPCKGINPKEDATVNGGHWKHIPNYQAIYAQIIFAEFAKLGSAIMFGDYLMSQTGLNLATKKMDTNYKDYPDNFKPSTLLNLKDGSGHFALGNITWNSQGDLSIIGDFMNVSPEGDRIEIKAASSFLGPSSRIAIFDKDNNRVMFFGSETISHYDWDKGVTIIEHYPFIKIKDEDGEVEVNTRWIHLKSNKHNYDTLIRPGKIRSGELEISYDENSIYTHITNRRWPNKAQAKTNGIYLDGDILKVK